MRAWLRIRASLNFVWTFFEGSFREVGIYNYFIGKFRQSLKWNEEKHPLGLTRSVH